MRTIRISLLIEGREKTGREADRQKIDRQVARQIERR